MSKHHDLDYLVITDGGAFNKPHKLFDASSAYLIFFRPDSKKQAMNQSVHLDSGGMVTVDRTMAYGEMNAIAIALENLLSHCMALPEEERKHSTIRIYTDSNNCYMTLTHWIYSWLKHGDGLANPLRRNTGDIPMNADSIMRAFVAKSQLQELGVTVRMYHINSHTAKKKLGDTRIAFQNYNDCLISKEDFEFLYTMNKVCDTLVRETYNRFKETGDIYNKDGVKEYYR